MLAVIEVTDLGELKALVTDLHRDPDACARLALRLRTERPCAAIKATVGDRPLFRPPTSLRCRPQRALRNRNWPFSFVARSGMMARNVLGSDEAQRPSHMTHKALTGGGWMIEIMSSGLAGRRRRYLVAIADRAEAVAAILHDLGSDTDVTSVVAVSLKELEIANVCPGQIAAV